MEGAKKFLAAAGLVVVIIAAVVLIIRYNVAGGGQPKPPAEILNAKIKLVNVKSFAIAEMTRGELDKLPIDPKTSYFKGPNGDMAMPMDCANCKATIPMPPIPKLAEAAPTPGAPPNAPNSGAAAGATPPPPPPVAASPIVAAMKDYICPKCGKNVAPRPPL